MSCLILTVSQSDESVRICRYYCKHEAVPAVVFVLFGLTASRTDIKKTTEGETFWLKVKPTKTMHPCFNFVDSRELEYIL